MCSWCACLAYSVFSWSLALKYREEGLFVFMADALPLTSYTRTKS